MIQINMDDKAENALETQFPDHEKQLTLIPGPPKCCKDDPFVKLVMGHRSSIELISSCGLHGFLVSGLLVSQLPKELISQSTDNLTSSFGPKARPANSSCLLEISKEPKTMQSQGTIEPLKRPSSAPTSTRAMTETSDHLKRSKTAEYLETHLKNLHFEGTLGSSDDSKHLKSPNHSEVLTCSPNRQREVVPPELDIKCSFGSVFVHSPSLNKLFVFKNVAEKLSKKSIESVCVSATSQIKILDNIFTSMRSSSPEILDLDLILLPEKSISETNFALFEHKISEACNELRSLKLNIFMIIKRNSLVYVQDKNQEALLLSEICSSENYPASTTVSAFLSRISNQKSYYAMSERSFKGFGDQVWKLNEVEKSCHALNHYFPEKESKLQTVPSIDCLKDNLLYCTDENGSLVFGKGIGTESYLGEVKLFLERFFNYLPSPTGILLKGKRGSC